MIRTQYTRPDRYLQLGTIVRRGATYMICVQPLCDSVRLEPNAMVDFPFLPLTVVANDLGPADFVVQERSTGTYKRLAVQGRPTDLTMYGFKAAERGLVTASREGDELSIRRRQ